jgi:hypothetical protein
MSNDPKPPPAAPPPSPKHNPDDWMIGSVSFYRAAGSLQGMSSWSAMATGAPDRHITVEETPTHVVLIFTGDGPVQRYEVSKTQCDVSRITKAAFEAWKKKQPPR